jgi:CO/xanthine dehydrogenase Mo-binding subunit
MSQPIGGAAGPASAGPASREAVSRQSLHVVGTSVARADGLGHVTGRTRYTTDRTFPGMLHLKVVRSPVHHARLRGIDLSEAERVPGFVRALVAADVPHNVYTILSLIGVEPEEEFLLTPVGERVRYKGEPVAAIVAETEQAALEAVAAVRLDLEELPAVLDVEAALRPDAPVVTQWGNNTFMYEGHPCRRVRFGDVEAGFAQADHIVESVYQTRPIEHAPTETTAAIAVPEPDGRYTVHTNTQALYFSLDNTAIILQVPGKDLHFVGGTVGGGFGGKVDVIVEPLATLAAMRTGRPVRYAFSRSEEMQVSSTRSAWRIRIRDGVMNDGRIVARQVTSYADSGAYSRQTPYALTKHAANAAGPYAIPNVSIDAYCVYTNRVPSSAMRGFGVTMASYALEVQMDKLAEVVGLDPWTIRFVNAYHDGDVKPHRKVVEDATLIETMQAAAKLAGHDLPAALAAMSSAPRPAGPTSEVIPAAVPAPGPDRRPPAGPARGKLRGTGMSAVNYPTGMNLGGDPSQALLHATTSGTFVVSLSSTDLGQGLRTVIGQIAAEALGVRMADVHIDTADTDTGPHCMGTFASRATHRVGNAVLAAAIEARDALLDVAAEELEAARDDLAFDGQGNLFVQGSPERTVPVTRIASIAQFTYGRTISGRGAYMKPKSPVDPETGAMDPDSTEAHACVVAEVEVDTETGEVSVLSLKTAYEVGRQVNPALVRGQIIGGAWMGLSHALYESTQPYYPDPDHSPKDFSEYVMPGPDELPEIETVVLEYPSSNGPYGIKGVGEMTANAPIPAIVNAISNAIGVRIDELPITPERILRALDSRAATPLTTEAG